MNDYSRSFIPLKQDSLGFSFGEKQPVGKCIIEITKSKRVKISVSVSNIKPNILYKVYLVSGKDAGSVCAGTLPVDSYGKGEAKWEYDSWGILDSGLTAALIDVVTVIVPNEKGYTAVLTGYKDYEVMWKNNFKPLDTISKKAIDKSLELVNKSVAENTENTVEHTEEGTVYDNSLSDETDEDINLDDRSNGSKTCENNINTDFHNLFMEMAADIENELNAPNGYEILSDADFVKLMSEVSANTGGIEYIFNKNLQILPFVKQSKQLDWIKIGLRELIYLPLNYEAVANDPIVSCLYRKYRHLILGRSKGGNEEEYYLGVPSFYDTEYTKVLAQLGFEQFKTCEDDAQSRVGYYLMTIKCVS